MTLALHLDVMRAFDYIATMRLVCVSR